MLELASRVEARQHALGRRFARFLVGVHRDAAAVVAHRARAVGVENDLDAVAVAAHGFVYGVVHGLVHEVVESVGARIADVHRGALANRLESLEDLDVARGIGVGAHARSPAPAPMDSATVPPLTSHQTAPLPSGSSESAVVRKTCPLRPA